MKLPNHERATVPQPKIVDYLLSETHPIGRHKATVFLSFGFTADRWLDLSLALVRHAAEYEVTKAEDSPFGTRYVIEGIMPPPDSRSPLIRTVWFVDTGADVPRFVTAYPLGVEK
jgi:Domain of unknown function (DUF6883)